MTERPILFSGPMVRAILDGRKTHTRRVVKPQPFTKPLADGERYVTEEEYRINAREGRFRGPYGAPGDRLWVRETWGMSTIGNSYVYAADNLLIPKAVERDARAMFARPANLAERPAKWSPSIHMPRWASRLTLEVVSVRVERLQEISEADARAEGGPPGHPTISAVSRSFGYEDFPRSWFAQTWDSINAERAPWDSNPWVWVVEFRRA